MKSLTCLALGVVVCTVLAVASSHAQTRVQLLVTPTVEQGYEVFEISGVGWPANQKVRISATNRRTDDGITLSTLANESGAFSGVFIGRDSDGNHYVVAAGTWRVKAKSGETVVRTSFDARRRAPEGTYAGPEAALRVSTGEAEIILPCNEGRTNGPILLDAEGNFSVNATLKDLRGPVEGRSLPARVDGSFKGGVITFTVVVFGENGSEIATFGPFEVVLGREPRFERCV